MQLKIHRWGVGHRGIFGKFARGMGDSAATNNVIANSDNDWKEEVDPQTGETWFVNSVTAVRTQKRPEVFRKRDAKVMEVEVSKKANRVMEDKMQEFKRNQALERMKKLKAKRKKR
eukprot:TRINITY_DN3475_c0_g2_i3.p1 TRINITY_DN3475_c0_g2~~TRINITY_DN3475_c0_g2_i3.p1  ORF type:complete len:116 (+),score=41.22 TRINITY_DN3475_c0_g2_i3:211-558(+)